MDEYTNRGTIMHLTLRDCTVINRGTIMHLDGHDNNVENRGYITHNEGGRVVIMGNNCNQTQQVKEKVVYRDRVIYRNRPVYKNSNEVGELQEKLRQMKKKLKDSADAQHVQGLENKIAYYENQNAKLKRNVEDLQREIDNTERQKLLKQIDNLKEQLKRSENRERTSRKQQYERGYQAGVVDGSNKKKEVFDWGVRPTKEQAEAIMRQLLIWLDCED